MMGRLIINIKDGITDELACELVLTIIKDGFVSEGSNGRQYLRGTLLDDNVTVFTTKNKNDTHTFNVYRWDSALDEGDHDEKTD